MSLLLEQLNNQSELSMLESDLLIRCKEIITQQQLQIDKLNCEKNDLYRQCEFLKKLIKEGGSLKSTPKLEKEFSQSEQNQNQQRKASEPSSTQNFSSKIMQKYALSLQQNERLDNKILESYQQFNKIRKQLLTQDQTYRRHFQFYEKQILKQKKIKSPEKDSLWQRIDKLEQQKKKLVLCNQNLQTQKSKLLEDMRYKQKQIEILMSENKKFNSRVQEYKNIIKEVQMLYKKQIYNLKTLIKQPKSNNAQSKKYQPSSIQQLIKYKKIAQNRFSEKNLKPQRQQRWSSVQRKDKFTLENDSEYYDTIRDINTKKNNEQLITLKEQITDMYGILSNKRKKLNK